MPSNKYYINGSGRTLQVLKALAQQPATKRTLKGVTDAMAASSPDLDITEFKVRSDLATLEAEGFITSQTIDEITLYGCSPMLILFAHRFFDSKRQALEDLMTECRQASDQLSIGVSSGD
ncbi:MAG TPA: hypothetical protein DCP69_00150 [Candidatus Omnitrophica bacterium]|nr:hypothetical protein [Candidatus Omnitrophota bacterium]